VYSTCKSARVTSRAIISARVHTRIAHPGFFVVLRSSGSRLRHISRKVRDFSPEFETPSMGTVLLYSTVDRDRKKVPTPGTVIRKITAPFVRRWRGTAVDEVGKTFELRAKPPAVVSGKVANGSREIVRPALLRLKRTPRLVRVRNELRVPSSSQFPGDNTTNTKRGTTRTTGDHFCIHEFVTFNPRVM